jgi:hypothetical protein
LTRRLPFAGLAGGLIGLAFVVRQARRGEWQGSVWLLAFAILLVIMSVWFAAVMAQQRRRLARVRSRGDYTLVAGVFVIGSDPPNRAIDSLASQTRDAVLAAGAKGIELWPAGRAEVPAAVVPWAEITGFELAAAAFGGVDRPAVTVTTLGGAFAFFIKPGDGTGLMPANSKQTAEWIGKLQSAHPEPDPNPR